jgi:uncharacterized membrane protein
MKLSSKGARRLFKPRKRGARRGAALAGAAGLGASVMFLLDPDRGARRRALLRDKTAHALRRTGDVLDKGSRDLRYRLRGVVAETRALFRDGRVSDDVLVQRVRSRMGRAVTHPHAIEVGARDGRVTLRGPILAGDRAKLVSAVAAVPGVTGIDDQLEVHEQADAVPSLQGGHRRTAGRFDLFRQQWSPLTRILMGAASGGLLAYGLSRRDPLGIIAGGAGAALLARDVANRPVKHLLGIGAGTRAVDFHKTITVHAPLEDVFQFWMNVENFPRFMSHLREVRRLDDGRLRWVAVGPAGISIAWEAEITQVVPNKLMAWQSAPGSAVGNAGVARFEPNPDGSTRLDIQMSYNPPAGALGHAVAALFGADPKHAMDEDLVRLQSILERGKTTAHGHEVRFSDLAKAS